MGMFFEGTSNWLAKRDSQLLRTLSCIVNPTRGYLYQTAKSLGRTSELSGFGLIGKVKLSRKSVILFRSRKNIMISKKITVPIMC